MEDRPLKSRPSHFHLGREIAGDVEDEVGGTVGEGVHRAVVGGHDRHVRRDSTIIGVQRRNIRL